MSIRASEAQPAVEHTSLAAGTAVRGGNRLAALPWAWAALAAITTLDTAVLAWASLSQHYAYNTNAYDLSWFDQLAGNAAHGRLFRTSFLPYSFLGNHFEPVVLLLGALYRLWSSPAALLLLQAIAVSLAAVPLFAGAKRLLGSAGAALLVAAAYLLAPQIHRAELFDFHPEMLAPLCICLAFALLTYRRAAAAVAVLSLVFLLKEDAWLIAIGFACLCWLLGARRAATVLLALAALYLVIVVGKLMPHYRGPDQGLTWRYDYLGAHLRDYPLTALRHPERVWSHLTQPVQLRHVAGLLASQALLPLTGPALLAVLPLTLAHLLSAYPQQSVLDFQYAVAPTVLLLLAAVLGVRGLIDARLLQPLWARLRLAGSRRAVALGGALLLAEAAAFLLSSPLGLRYDAALYRQTAHTHIVAQALRLIPRGAPVSAQTGLLPHLSERQEIHEFPDLGSADYVAIDRLGRRSSQSIAAGYGAQLAALPAEGFCPIFDRDGVQVYERCALLQRSGE